MTILLKHCMKYYLIVKVVTYIPYFGTNTYITGDALMN